MSGNDPMPAMEVHPIYHFQGVQNLAMICNAQFDRRKLGLSNHEYCEFEGVTRANLSEIDRFRHVIGKGIRITYFNDGRMIVKISPTVVHERATLHFTVIMYNEVTGMGMPLSELDCVGGTRYQGRTRAKEPNGAFQPPAFRQSMEWPTVVIETGYSESEFKLREDARFWLDESAGDVKTVLLFIVKPRNSCVRIEKWELVQPPPLPPRGPKPLTRAFATAQNIPSRAPMAAMVTLLPFFGTPVLLERL